MDIVFGDTTAAAAAVICFATCSLYLLALCIIIVIIIIVVVVVCHGSTTGPWRSNIPSLRRRQAENSQPRPSQIVVVFQSQHDLHHKIGSSSHSGSLISPFTQERVAVEAQRTARVASSMVLRGAAHVFVLL